MASLDGGPFWPRGRLLLHLGIVLSLFLFSVSAAGISGPATNFTFGNGFNSLTELALEQDAQYNRTTQSILLTASSTQTQSEFACGMLFYNQKVAIRESSFSTTFTFTIRSPYDSWGDGFAFTVREDEVIAGAAGEYLCLLSAATDANPANHVFAVEFDTFMNDYDPSNNHIGVDVFAIESVTTYNLCGGVVENCTYFVNQGEFTAWIDYDNPNHLLEVRFSNGSGVQRPETAVITLNVDLSSIVTDDMYVGFLGATGLKFEIHEIISWSFNSSFAPGSAGGGLNANKKLALGLSVPFAALAVLTIVGCAVISRRLMKQSAAFRALEQELVRQQVQPCLYLYNEIKAATRDFHLSNKLGEGGFGVVYFVSELQDYLVFPIEARQSFLNELENLSLVDGTFAEFDVFVLYICRERWQMARKLQRRNC